MNLLNVISNEEPIGGLEIADDGFRYSKLKKDKNGFKIDFFVEEKISGKETLSNEATFIDKLSRFVKKNNIKYVIITIATDNVFSKIYNFPSVMTDDKIADSMQLTIDLQLPKKGEEIYCDWMKIEDGTEKKIFLSYAEKNYINSLVAKIKKTGLKIVAIESHALSIARAIKQNKDEVVIALEKDIQNTSFLVIKNNTLLFSQLTPNDKLSGGLAKEIKKIVNYFTWFDTKIESVILLSQFDENEIKKFPVKIVNIDLVDELKQIKDPKWLISMGAALRGLMPRKDDKIVSFMEIGTEEAYKREKANATVNFFLSMSIALSIFFVAVFLAALSLVTILQNNYDRQILSFNLSSSSENATSARDNASYFNSLISQISTLVMHEPRWSQVVTEIESKVTDGIIVSNLALPSADGQFSVTGTAANREAINVLRKSFESSAYFSEVNIPLNNLGKKEDIPFSMTFKIKSPALIYVK